jgi:hypothetical protein
MRLAHGWTRSYAAATGLRVVAVARRRERLEELQKHMLGPAVGLAAADFLPVVCDVTKEAEVQVRRGGLGTANGRWSPGLQGRGRRLFQARRLPHWCCPA